MRKFLKELVKWSAGFVVIVVTFLFVVSQLSPWINASLKQQEENRSKINSEESTVRNVPQLTSPADQTAAQSPNDLKWDQSKADRQQRIDIALGHTYTCLDGAIRTSLKIGTRERHQIIEFARKACSLVFVFIMKKEVGLSGPEIDVAFEAVTNRFIDQIIQAGR